MEGFVTLRKLVLLSSLSTLYIVLIKFNGRFGRRTAFFLLLFMATSLGVAIAFAPNYTVFTILRWVVTLTIQIQQILQIIQKTTQSSPSSGVLAWWQFKFFITELLSHNNSRFHLKASRKVLAVPCYRTCFWWH